MSYNLFPTLTNSPSQIQKTPTWNTSKERTPAGNEFRVGFQTYPVNEFSFAYPYLSQADKDALEGFLNHQGGSLTPFYFDVLNDDTIATPFRFGTGDGASEIFTLLKPAGSGASEPIGGVNGNPLIYKSDWQGNQLQYATPRTNYATYSETPMSWSAIGVTLTAKTSIVPGQSSALASTGASPLSNAQTYSTFTAGSFANVTATLYVEYASSATITVEFYDSTGAVTLGSAMLTFGTGIIQFAGVGVTGSATNLGTGPNGGTLYKIILTTPSAASGHSLEFVALPAGSPAVANVGSILHAVQIEAGTIATSIISTTSSAPVTVTDYTLTGNLVTFAVAPLLNAALTWTGQYYYLVRFDDDKIQFAQFANGRYKTGTIKLVQAL